MKRDAKRTEERVKLQNIDLLPYPVEHLVMPVPNDGRGVTYSSPTLAAFVDAIAAQNRQARPSRRSIRIL